MCDYCDRTKAENSNLRSENSKLRKEIVKLKECIADLQEAVDCVINFLNEIVYQGNKIMSGRGIPKGRWAYVKGSTETANEAVQVIIGMMNTRC